MASRRTWGTRHNEEDVCDLNASRMLYFTIYFLRNTIHLHSSGDKVEMARIRHRSVFILSVYATWNICLACPVPVIDLT
jgi:hypothetical protein